MYYVYLTYIVYVSVYNAISANVVCLYTTRPSVCTLKVGLLSNHVSTLRYVWHFCLGYWEGLDVCIDIWMCIIILEQSR